MTGGSAAGSFLSSAEVYSPLLDDANVRIAANGTSDVGTSPTLTAHVTVCDGNGSHPAPDGTAISFTLDSGPGAFTTPSTCTVSGGTGSCSVAVMSAVTGVTTVSAHATLTVDGSPLTRATDGAGANSDPANVTWIVEPPGAPTGVTATPTNGAAVVSFTPPASNGGSGITSYTVTASPGGLTATGAASPLTVNGLTNGTTYTFTVRATNSVGSGPASAPSNAATPSAPPPTFQVRRRR